MLEEIVKNSIKAAQKATVFEGDFYAINGMSGNRYRYFINHLIKSLPDPSYLEVGLWGGSTFCSAIAGNKVRAVGVDDWSGMVVSGGQVLPAPRDEFHKNLVRTKAQSPNADVRVYECDYRGVKDFGGPFDVFFYDGPHSKEDQTEGLRRALPALKDEFVFIVDDWNWEHIREGTREALNTVGLELTYSNEIRTGSKAYYALDGSMKLDPWHNGCFIAVVRKSAELNIPVPVPAIHGGVGAFYCSGASVTESWSECWERLIHLDSTRRKLIKVKGKSKGLYIPENRNKCVSAFLPWEPKCEWMLFVDTDVIFTVEDFYKLYDTAVANHCDVVGGAYYTFWNDGKSVVLPWLELAPEAKDGWRMITTPREELQDVISVGMGFTLINRRVLETMRDKMPNHRWAWFAHDEAFLPDGTIDCMGEDVTFCRRALKWGFKVQGYSGITVGHQKGIVLNEQNVREQVIEQKVKESA